MYKKRQEFRDQSSGAKNSCEIQDLSFIFAQRLDHYLPSSFFR
jgi:hypothetical protein